MKEMLYDMPVSNHGARCRMIIKAKQLQGIVGISKPDDIGGLKGPAYLKLNPQGKMPLLVTDVGDAILESDCISRYLLDKYAASPGPSFVPNTLSQKYLSEQLVRLHDVYISPIQGAMYKAPGTPFSIFCNDRLAAIAELRKQIEILESLVVRFEAKHPDMVGEFLCGSEISLADAAVFPTMVFCQWMLPRYFPIYASTSSSTSSPSSPSSSSCLGPRLTKWWNHMNTNVAAAKEIRKEIEDVFTAWKDGGRWEPIVEELKARKSV
jgi:glutathione S-transferase